MKRAVTNELASIEAKEFVWREAGLLENHLYVLPALLRWLGQREKRILDLGCGNGAATGALSSRGFEVVGFDGSASGIEIASRTYPKVRFIQGNLQEPLPLELRGQSDVVISIDVIEHLFFPRAICQRAREALGSKGTLILTTPYHGYCKNLALAVLNRYDDHWHPLRDYGHIKFFSPRTLSRLLREEGFRPSRTGRLGRLPFLAKTLMLEGLLE
jgi:2-polyprenyl-3-methyl-5-hydroxy-6-metoxy-1,4-benzoquinol methylase